MEEPGQVAPSSGAAENIQEPEKLGTIRGTVTGPQGPVEGAAVILGEKVVATEKSGDYESIEFPPGEKVVATEKSGDYESIELPPGEKVVATEKSGDYEFTELPPGTYEVFVVAPKGLDYRGQPIEVVIESGQVAVVNFTVEKPKAILEVYVYNEAGGPIEGAVVSGVLIGTKIESRTTDDKGLARFEDVVAGDRYARVKARGYVAELRDFKAEEGTTMRLDFHLRPGAYKITGRITSSDDGRPLAAQIEFMKKDFLVKWLVMQKTTSSDQDGNYEIPDLESGEYGLTVIAPNYQMGGWTGSVSADTRVDIKLDRAPTKRPPRTREERERPMDIVAQQLQEDLEKKELEEELKKS